MTAEQYKPIYHWFNTHRPHGRLGRRQHGLQPAQVFIAQGAVGGLVHIVGVGGALGVDIEHDPAVKAVGGSQTLHTF